MNLSARLRYTVRLKQAKAKRISALENFQPGGTRLAEIGVEQSEILINPRIEKSLKNLRGVFTIYKPPHTHPDQVKREIDSTLLQYLNDEQGKMILLNPEASSTIKNVPNAFSNFNASF